MSNQVRQNFSLSSQVIDTINDISSQSNITKSSLVEKAIRYYIENEGRDYKSLYSVLDSMFSHIENKIDGIENEINKNTSAINDLKNESNISSNCWNDYLIRNNIRSISLVENDQSEAINEIKNKQNKILSKKRTKAMNEK